MAAVASMVMIVAVGLTAFHTSSIGHTRDLRGRYIHTMQVEHPTHGTGAGFNAARPHGIDGDECALASHTTAALDDPFVPSESRTRLEEACGCPRGRGGAASASYRQAPKTSPPAAAPPSA